MNDSSKKVVDRYQNAINFKINIILSTFFLSHLYQLSDHWMW